MVRSDLCPVQSRRIGVGPCFVVHRVTLSEFSHEIVRRDQTTTHHDMPQPLRCACTRAPSAKSSARRYKEHSWRTPPTIRVIAFDRHPMSNMCQTNGAGTGPYEQDQLGPSFTERCTYQGFRGFGDISADRRIYLTTRRSPVSVRSLSILETQPDVPLCGGLL